MLDWLSKPQFKTEDEINQYFSKLELDVQQDYDRKLSDIALWRHERIIELQEQRIAALIELGQKQT